MQNEKQPTQLEQTQTQPAKQSYEEPKLEMREKLSAVTQAPAPTSTLVT